MVTREQAEQALREEYGFGPKDFARDDPWFLWEKLIEKQQWIMQQDEDRGELARVEQSRRPWAH